MNALDLLVPLVQILVATTLAITAGWLVSAAIPRRYAVAHERLWTAALIAVALSPMVPLTSYFLADTGLIVNVPAVEPENTALASASRPIAATTAATADQTERVSPSAHTRAFESPRGRVAEDHPVHAMTADPAESSAATHAVRTPEAETPVGVRPELSSLALATWVVLLAYICGVLWRFARAAVGWRICRRILSNAVPLDSVRFAEPLADLCRALRIQSTPPVLVSTALPSPAVLGVVQPRIVIPTALLEWATPAQVLHVLLHESAHIIRHDPVINLLQSVVRAFYWFHPLVHLMNRRLHQAREDVCDNFVLVHTEAPDYAETLLQVAQSHRSPALGFSGLAILPSENSLESRVAGLLDASRSLSTAVSLPRRCATYGLALLVVTLPGVVRVSSGSEQASEPKSAPDTAARDESRATEPDKPAGSITGRVVLKRDGTPAEGAEVTLLFPPRPGQNAYIWPLSLRRTRTDANGAFSFESLPAGRYRVWANRGRMTSRTESLGGESVTVPEDGGAAKPIELQLKDGVVVTARVEDRSTGEPISGAVVHLGWSDLEGFRTDEQGEATVQPLTPQRWYIEAWADGHAKESQWLNLESGKDASIEFSLGPGGTIEGFVRSPAGEPIEGAGVSAQQVDGPSGQFAYVKTDAQGHYEISHVPLNTILRLDISKPDFVRTQKNALLTNGKQRVDATLTPRPHGGSIQGIVVDHRGEPISGAELVNYGRSSSQIRKAKTGPDGRFLLDDLYEGSTGHEVIVRAKRFAPRRISVEPGPAEDPRETEIKLALGHRISGRVVDEQERPLEGVIVYFARGNRLFSLGGKTTTDENGRFELDSLPEECSFTFRKSGFSEIQERPLPLDRDDTVTVVMQPQGVIRGKVLDGYTGKPIRTFNVRLNFSPQRKPDEPSTSISTRWLDPGQNFNTEDGTFEWTGLTAGMPLQVTVHAEGYERTVNQRIVARPPKDAEQVEFVLAAVDPEDLTTFSGRLLNFKGEPVAGAEVRLIAAEGRNPADRRRFPFNWTMIETGQIASQAQVLRFEKAVTDKQGRFAFTRIPRAADVELAWWGEGIPPGRYDVRDALSNTDRRKIEIRLDQPARILGQIDRAEFPQADHISVHSDTVDYLRLNLKPGQTQFEIADLAPGTYHISLMGRPQRTSRGSFTSNALESVRTTLEAGDEKTVSFGEPGP